MLRLSRPLVRSLPTALALLPPLALAAAALVTASFQIDRGAAASTAFLGWLALGVLAPLALLPGAPRALAPAATLAVAVALLGLPHLGVLRPAVTMALLGAALIVLGAANRGAPRGRGTWLALALAAQLVAHADRLFLAPTALATAGVLVALPAVAALALDRLERGEAGGARRATAAALLAFLAGPGWTPAGVAGLALAVAADRLLAARPAARAAAVVLAAGAPLALGPEPRWLALALVALAALAVGAAPAPSRLATGALAALALGATLGATLPWQRPAPLATLLAGLLAPSGQVIERPLESQPAVLSAGAPRYQTALGGAPVRAVVIDSYLTRSVELRCGTPFARVRVEGSAAPREATLEIGRDSAEWAADRPDVAAALACPAPPSWSSWLPAGGRFLGHHYRARLRLDPPLPAGRLVIERASDLPEATTLALFHVATER